MDLRAFTTARLVAAAVVLAGEARASVTGSVEVQGQSTASRTQSGGPGSQSALLMETLSLRYAGMPLGPAVAVATAGGGLSNVRGWADGTQRFDARVYSFDASVGLLPRRAVPLRLYASGAVPDGSTGLLATAGAGPSLLYGGALQAQPGRLLPGLRLDASESRSSRPGHSALSDLQQRISASGFGSVAGQRVDASFRAERERRDAAGEVDGRTAIVSISSPFHQTNLLATEVHRSFSTLSGITDDRTATAASSQRWSSRLSTQLGARVAEVSAGGATGTVGDASASATWVPVQARQQVTLSAGASAGFSRTSAAGQRSGSTTAGNARAGWSRPLGPVSLGVGAGASVSDCDCSAAAAGTVTLLDGSASLSLAPGGRLSAQGDYTVASAAAPAGRGGDRLEHRARTFARLAVGAASQLTGGVSFDDAVRELVDIRTGDPATVRERAVGASLGAATRAGPTALSAEIRHSRGRIVTEAGSPFVVGGALSVPTVTTAQASLSWTPRHALAVQGQLVALWTELAGLPDTTSVGATGSVSYRLGRISIAAQYQTFRVETSGAAASLQQSVRAVLSRPFEL